MTSAWARSKGSGFEPVGKKLLNAAPFILLLLAGAWALCLYFFRTPLPPIGTYVAILGFWAALVTIWPPAENRGWSKAAWVVLFALLMSFEVHNLYRDRTEHDREQNDARRHEDDRFAGILKQNQAEFDATMKRFDAVLTKTQEAVSVTTGGNAFPFAMPALNPTADGKHEIGFSLQVQGTYPLYRLSVSVGRAYRSRSDPKQIRSFGGTIQRDESSAGLAGAIIVSLPEPVESPAYYMAVMTARNGQWEEIIQARSVGSTHVFRWVVYGSSWLMPSLIYGPYKKLLDLADHDFPAAARRESIYPLDPQLLPVEPLPQTSR
jgi:hypothetical protein